MIAPSPPEEPLWPFPPELAVALMATGVVYLRGFHRIRTTRPRQFPPWRMVCFLSGLGSLWLALASPLDTLNEQLLVLHMAQHMVLMLVAPPLLLLGSPTAPLLRGLPQRTRALLGPLLFRRRLLRRMASQFLRPPVAWAAAVLVFVGWHMPPAYELALRDPLWHEVEHLSFLASSLLFWFPVIEPWPGPVRPWSRWWMLPYLVSADVVNTALAAWLTFSRKVAYPTYAATPRRFAITPLNDQAAAGALMWVVGSMFYLAPLAVIIMELLSPSPRGLREEPSRSSTDVACGSS